MGLTNLLWSVAFFWVAVHIMACIVKSRSRSVSVLPLSHTLPRASKFQADVNFLSLKVQSVYLNSYHEALSQLIGKSPIRKRVLGAFYNLGVFAAALGALIGIIALAWSAWDLVRNVTYFHGAPRTDSRRNFNKRSQLGMVAPDEDFVNLIVSL